jgi:hypothetical protein
VLRTAGIYVALGYAKYNIAIRIELVQLRHPESGGDEAAAGEKPAFASSPYIE